MTTQAAFRSATPASRRTGARRGCRAWLRGALVAACLPLAAAAADDAPSVVATDDEPTLEELERAEFPRFRAGYVRNFLRYVKWPKTAFKSPRSPFVVCIFGDDPLAEVLRAKREDWKFERPMEVLHLVHAKDVRDGGCHIVYLGEAARSSQELIVCLLHGQPALTVSEADDFWDVGGGVRLKLRLREFGYKKDGSVDWRSDNQFFVNLDATRPVGLKVDSKMLALATKILQNGIERSKD